MRNIPKLNTKVDHINVVNSWISVTYRLAMCPQSMHSR
jgi:hypothetical protein